MVYPHINIFVKQSFTPLVHGLGHVTLQKLVDVYPSIESNQKGI